MQFLNNATESCNGNCRDDNKELNRQEKRKFNHESQKNEKKRKVIKSNARGNKHPPRNARGKRPREALIREAKIISDCQIVDMIRSLDEACSCVVCTPCNFSNQSNSNGNNCSPKISCLRENFSIHIREDTEGLKEVIRSCRESLLNKDKEEKESAIIQLFKDTVRNGDEFFDFHADPEIAYDDNGLPRYESALKRQKQAFQHEYKLPGNIVVCGPVFKAVYGISKYTWDMCSRALRFNFDAVKISHKPYTDSTLHNVTHAEVRDIYANNVLDPDTYMPVGDTQGGNIFIYYYYNI